MPCYEGIKVNQDKPIPNASRDLSTQLDYLKVYVHQLDRRVVAKLRVKQGVKSPVDTLYKPLRKLERAVTRLQEPKTKFQKHLKKLISKCGITPYRLSSMSGIDPTYVRRLMTGERRNPSRQVVADLAEALKEYSTIISDRDTNRLVKRAGYPPLRQT